MTEKNNWILNNYQTNNDKWKGYSTSKIF